MISINDKIYPLNVSVGLAELLHSLNIVADRGMAIAVNNVVVPKDHWSGFKVNKNDKIILIKATQGG